MEDSKLPSTRLKTSFYEAENLNKWIKRRAGETGWKKAGEERKLTIRVSFLLIIRESFLIV
jgi:hypothetical protein